MLALLADENFKDQIVTGLRRRLRGLGTTKARVAGLLGKTDSKVHGWAAEEDRQILTPNTRTMKGLAYYRMDKRLPMPGVVEIPCADRFGITCSQQTRMKLIGIVMPIIPENRNYDRQPTSSGYLNPTSPTRIRPFSVPEWLTPPPSSSAAPQVRSTLPSSRAG